MSNVPTIDFWSLFLLMPMNIALWTKTHDNEDISLTFAFSLLGGVHQSRQLLSRTEWRWQSKSGQRSIQFRSSICIQWDASASSTAGYFGRKKSQNTSLWLQEKFTVINFVSRISSSRLTWTFHFFDFPVAPTMRWSFTQPMLYYSKEFWCSIFQPSEICSTWNYSWTQIPIRVSRVEVRKWIHYTNNKWT